MHNATTSQPVTPAAAAMFQPGDLVDITIRGARVMAARLGFGDVLTLAYEEVEPGVFATIELRHPRAGSVTIERVAPADWPPQPGDVWEDRRGILWFAIEFKTGFAMQSGSGVVAPIGRLLNEASPLTLVYRREDAR